jgi:hypothetical protein
MIPHVIKVLMFVRRQDIPGFLPSWVYHGNEFTYDSVQRTVDWITTIDAEDRQNCTEKQQQLRCTGAMQHLHEFVDCSVRTIGEFVADDELEEAQIWLSILEEKIDEARATIATALAQAWADLPADHPQNTICRLLSTVCRLPSAVCHLPSAAATAATGPRADLALCRRAEERTKAAERRGNPNAPPRRRRLEIDPSDPNCANHPCFEETNMMAAGCNLGTAACDPEILQDSHLKLCKMARRRTEQRSAYGSKNEPLGHRSTARARGDDGHCRACAAAASPAASQSVVPFAAQRDAAQPRRGVAAAACCALADQEPEHGDSIS